MLTVHTGTCQLVAATAACINAYQLIRQTRLLPLQPVGQPASLPVLCIPAIQCLMAGHTG